jgi:hypothetical protein
MPSIRQHYHLTPFGLHLSQANAGRAMSLDPHSGPTLRSLGFESYAISGQETVKRFQLIVVKDLWRSRTMERAQRES